MRNISLAGLAGLLLLPQTLLAQSPPSAKTDVFASDVRLQQAVTVRAEGVPVGDLLTQIAQKTGVALKADLYVADDKVIVFSPARPLRDTLRDMAALFNDQWESTPLPGGQTRYMLIRRLKARHYEDDLEQEVSARMMVQMDAQVKALSETPEQLAKRPTNDPIRRNLEYPSTHGRQATRLYGQLSREQRHALFANGYVNVSFAASTPSQQEMAREAFGEVVTTLKTIDEKQRAEFPNVHVVIDTSDVLEQHGMRFRLTRTNNAGLSAQVLQVILGQNTYMTMGTFDSGAQWLLPPHDDPYTRKTVFQDFGQGSFHTGNPYLRKDVPPSAELPAPEAVSKASGAGAWIDRLSALSQAADIPVMADYYRSPALVHDLKDITKDTNEANTASVTAHEAVSSALLSSLDALCKPSGYLWWTAGKTLLLRKRDWYAQRRYEVSDAWMRSVAGRLRRQKGVPTYADLGRLLDLTPAQIAGLNGALEGAGEAMADLETQEGLHELLTWIQASKEAWESLPVGEPAQSEKRPPMPPTAQPAPPQNPLLGAFLNTIRQPATPDAVHNFSVVAYCYTPAMLKVLQTPAAQNVQINLQWKVEGGSKVPNVSSQRWILWLPLQIPADRSDRTTIDVAPAPAQAK
jgi:hypothetical protein